MGRLLQTRAHAPDEPPPAEGAQRKQQDAGEPQPVKVGHEVVEDEAVGLTEGRGGGCIAEVEMERPRGRSSDAAQAGGGRVLRERLIERGFLIHKSPDGDGEHAEQCAEGEHVARVGRAARERDVGNAIDEGDSGALPEEVDKRPAESFPVVCHRRFLLRSMRVRSASRSWSLTGSRASACIASCAADPAKRRSEMSRTSWS